MPLYSASVIPLVRNLSNLITSQNGGQVVASDPNNPTAPFSALLLNAVTILTGVQPVFRNVDSEVEITAATTSINGSLAGVRGNVTHDAAGTLGSGSFVYGVQGKVTEKGTLNTGSGFVAGVFAQLDMSAMTAMTSGYFSGLHVDMGATSTIVSSSSINAITVTNTTNCIMNAAMKVIVNAAYLFDLSDVAFGGAHFLVDTTATTAAGCIKVLAGGSVRYLQLYSSAS